MPTTTTKLADERRKNAHDLLVTASPRATYAHDVLDGKQLLSGADLKGFAKEFGGKYKEQREMAVVFLLVAGGHIRRGKHGKLTVEWEDVPEGAKKSACAVGPCWEY